MEDFEKELKQGFLEEAGQLLNDAEQCMLVLESNPDDEAVSQQLFRIAHNLKGSGNAVGFNELGKFTHKLESFLLKIKNKEIRIEKAVFNLLLRCTDHLRSWIDLLRTDLEAAVDSRALDSEITSALEGKSFEAVTTQLSSEALNVPDSTSFPPEESVQPDKSESSHPSTQQNVMEPVGAAAPAASMVHANAEPPKSTAKSKAQNAPTDESIRVSLARLEKLTNFVGELVILQSVVREQSLQSGSLSLRKAVHQLGKVTKELQDISLSLRMLPMRQTFQKMQRIVRDTSNALGKQVVLHLAGEEAEVDKTVLEQLGDPLVHLVRNAVDHGIESPERRKTAGKPEEGNLWLSAFDHSGNLIIEVRDDGGGIDPDKVRNKAVEKGIIKPQQVLTKEECYQLVFAPGFSTKQEVTDVSGRGVGMDVVKTNIEALQGKVEISTELGKGTTFRISLPLTLAIIDGMIVRCAQERFVIPLNHVHESVKADVTDIQVAANLGEILTLRGENLPLYRLSTLLGSPKAKSEDGVAIVSRTTGAPFAVIVDEIIGQAQVVIKKLGAEHRNIKGFNSSAILGDGKPALILELHELAQRNGARSVTGLNAQRRAS